MPELNIRKFLHPSFSSLLFLVFAFAAAPVTAQVTINEIRIDQPSTDNDEYFELAGAASTSLSGMTYLVIGDGTGGSGVIEAVVDLGGQSIPGSGFFVAAEGTFTIGTANLTTSLNFENSDNVTHLLVNGFTGSNGDDLDTNDDGILDVTPWSGIVDCVALIESVGSGDQVYCATGNGPDGSFVPAHSFFCPGGWQTGAFDPAGGDDTPGMANSCSAGDDAPEVTGTTPADSATGVDIDANIQIDFSEDVNVAGAWFAINCGTSGAHTAAVSGGPSSFTLNPDTDFVASEVCTVDVFSSGVTDVDTDDPPDNMDADFQFSFDTNPLVLSDLVINEIDYDQSGFDTAEFVEILNTGATDVDLNGHSIVLVNGNGGAPYSTINLPAVSLPAGGYYVVCGNAGNVYNCDLDVSPDSNLIQNGSPDAVALYAGAVLLDTVSYEGSVPGFTEGDGTGLSDSSSAAFLGISRFPDGTDTDVNNADFSRRCITPGFANTADDTNCVDPTPPPIRINEIDYDQPGSDTAEFVEIINAGNSAADLDGISLVLINGSNDTIYRSFALPAVMLDGGDYFVVCGNAANTVNCDLDVSPDSNLIQNGAPDAVALVRGGLVIDAVSYEGSVAAPYVEGSGDGLFDSNSSSFAYRGISRVPNGADTDQNNIDLVNVCITPGIANSSLTENCSPTGPLVEIFDIQGSGSTSPFDGEGVTTLNNVVTVVGPEGFFMQTPAARDDADVDTSNGIYVFTDSAPGVSVGDTVDVSGGINEFFEFTEFVAGSTITVTGTGALPPAIVFDASVPSPDPMAPSCAIEYECYEGMLVSVTGGTVSGPNQSFGSDPIAEVYVTAAGSRTFREPGIEFPGIFGYPEWDGNPELFELDPDKMGLANQVINAGSSFDAVGALGFEFGGYELWPSSLTVYPAPLPVAVRSRDINEMTVGALNLFRLYDDVDDAPIDVIVPGIPELNRSTDDTVVSTAEYERRLAKFSMYIRNVMDAPDVLAVSEVESLAVLQDLADRINADDGSINYTPYLEEGNDVGGIDVGFLVLDTVVVDNVTQLGRFEILDFDFSLLNDRPPLLLEGRQVADGSDFPFAVMAIHSRSLNGIDGSEGPRVRQKRYEQAQFVAQSVQDLQTTDPDINLVVAGDFNAFEFTDGYVDATGFMKGGFVALDNLVCETNPCDDLVNPNLMNQVLVIPAGERYSFNFRGNAQTLDHALTSTGLDELIRDYRYGRGNADAYEELIEDDSTPLRSSDHDGLVLYLAKDSDGDGVTDDIDYCPGTVIPEAAPTRELRINNFALVDDDRVFDTMDPEGVGPMASFDIFDTAGCSCEQIVEEAGLGKGHLMFGCSVGEMEAWVEFIDSL